MLSIVVIEHAREISSLFESKERSLLQVYTANTAHSAYVLVEEMLPDIILLEHSRFLNDQFETVRNFKTRLTTSRIPILLVADKAGRALVQESMENDVKGFLVKPMTREILIDRIKKVNETSENEKLRRKENIRGSFVYRVENHIHMNYFLYRLQQQFFTEFFQAYVKFQKSKPQNSWIVIDIRHLYFPDEEEIGVLKRAIASVQNHTVRMVAGKNYGQVMDLDLSLENQLFISMQDLQSYIRMKEAGEIDF